MKKQSSLRWKILKYLLVFVFAMISMIWLFQIVFLDSFYQSIKSKNLEFVASAVAETLDDEQIQQKIDHLSTENEVCVRVVQLLNKQVLPVSVQYVSTDHSACAVARLTDEQVIDYWNKAISNHGMIQAKTKEVIPLGMTGAMQFGYQETGHQDLLLAKSIGDDGLDALVLVSTRISPVNSTIETLRVQLSVMSVVICLMAVALAAFMTLKVTKPLEEINQATRILATGNYDVDFSASGYQEINELSETMNYAAQKLKEVDQMRRDLLSNVSHDLRTPLTMIEGYSEMMRDLPGENTPENAQVILDEAHRLTLLVNDLLDLSKLEEKKMILKIETVNLSELLNEIVKRYLKYTQSLNLKLVCDCDANLIIQCDPQRIEQVIYNFINNAIQYSASGKTIEIRCKALQNKVRFEIEDYGQGIAEEYLDSIWERYYKVDRQHVRSSSGSGIGLSICKLLLEMHHADYGVHSEVGQGTTFWFEFPLVTK